MRAPAGKNWHLWLKGLGIKVLHKDEKPGGRRHPNTVYGGRYLKRLWNQDEELAWLTVRCIQSSDPTCFDDVTIWGVFRYLQAHHPKPGLPHHAINHFRALDISLISRRARQIIRGQGDHAPMARTADAICILLAETILPRD